MSTKTKPVYNQVFWLRAKFFFLYCVPSYLLFVAFLIACYFLTISFGVVSISKNIADSVYLTIAYVALVGSYSFLAYYVISFHYHQKFVDFYKTNQLYSGYLSFSVSVTLFVRGVLLMLIAVVKVTELKVAHYILAGFVFFIIGLKEILAFVLRYKVIECILKCSLHKDHDNKKREGTTFREYLGFSRLAWKFIFIYNIILILLMLIFCLVFIGESVSGHLLTSQSIHADFEYLFVGMVPLMDTLHMFEFHNELS